VLGWTRGSNRARYLSNRVRDTRMVTTTQVQRTAVGNDHRTAHSLTVSGYLMPVPTARSGEQETGIAGERVRKEREGPPQL
jgi:hypothetical protein